MSVSVTSRLVPVIGLEVHAQLLTESKMFCGCSAQYAGAAPNTNVCAVCAGMPGALPVINRRAVEYTIMTALALGCSVPEESKFDRKNYMYPDLPKGYQITQYDQPLGKAGSLDYEVDGEVLRCGITRVHLEEDTGKSVHTNVDGREVSLVDYNRSGVPLMEIVTEADLRSPAAARELFATLRRVLMYMGVNDGNLQEGSMRADVNVSLQRADGTYGTKVEIKNLNSFRAVQRALEFEIERQHSVLEQGGVLHQETRGWSEAQGATLSQRSKEQAHDYRYFPEPDLPPLSIPARVVDSVRARLPELPSDRLRRLQSTLGLNSSTSRVLTNDKAVADFFESAVAAAGPDAAGILANWVTGDVSRLVNESGKRIEDSGLDPAALAKLVSMVRDNLITGKAGKQVLEEMYVSGEHPETIVERLNLAQISDVTALAQIVEQVLGENERAVQDYRKGKANAVQALMGQVMKRSKGKASPASVRDLLLAKLGEPVA